MIAFLLFQFLISFRNFFLKASKVRLFACLQWKTKENLFLTPHFKSEQKNCFQNIFNFIYFCFVNSDVKGIRNRLWLGGGKMETRLSWKTRWAQRLMVNYNGRIAFRFNWTKKIFSSNYFQLHHFEAKL